MKVKVFILCYNESLLITDTIKHYKRYLPNSQIVILDNYSTDNSVEIAYENNCDVVYFNSDNIQNEYIQRDLKNNCWKNEKDSWIIVVDMDEWLCITEKDLLKEQQNGTSILRVKGIDMIGESSKMDLTDINLHEIKKYIDDECESKNICFKVNDIIEMNYCFGAHNCNPVGRVQYSNKIYYNKHMSTLGLPYLTYKLNNRYERTHLMRSLGFDGHYTNDLNNIKNRYYNALLSSKILEL
jgi:glycosyltransferase involved in cell wall biosynthesis